MGDISICFSAYYRQCIALFHDIYAIASVDTRICFRRIGILTAFVSILRLIRIGGSCPSSSSVRYPPEHPFARPPAVVVHPMVIW